MEIAEATHPTQHSIADATLKFYSPSKQHKHHTAKLPKYEAAFAPLKYGPLLKKTLNTSWVERYFMLTPTRLLYFADAHNTQLKGCFTLTSLLEHGLRIQSNCPEIRLNCRLANSQEEEPQTRTLLALRARNHEQFGSWVRELESVLDGLVNLTYQVLEMFPRLEVEQVAESNQKIGKTNCNFWNHLSISKGELFRYAGHLDIIFLRSRASLSFLPRLFMRSHFDHVALLLKDEYEQVFVFEVVESRGVCVTPLQSLLLTYHQDYEQMGYRKLLRDGRQPLHHHSQLEDYINKLLGCKYELSLSKLLLNNDQQEGFGQETTIEQEQARTYFCSELIADIYLKFGLLQGGHSNDYWPKDFEEEELRLAGPFTLSPMMRVELPYVPQSSENLSTP